MRKKKEIDASQRRKQADKTKVLIVDDHSVVIEGVRKALEREPDCEIAGTARDGLRAVETVKTLKPDIVIMDVSMPDLNGVEATQQIKKWNQKIAVIIFTMYRDKEYIVSLFRTGASGYVFKDEPMDDLVLAVRAVREGGTYYSSSAQQILRQHLQELETDAAKAGHMQDWMVRLSLREKEIFPLLADGLSIKEIADRLCISPKTVESHKYNIMEKLEVDSVAALTKLAIKKDLIKL